MLYYNACISMLLCMSLWAADMSMPSDTRADDAQVNTEYEPLFKDEDLSSFENQEPGNWYEKMTLWKKAKSTYDGIKQISARIYAVQRELIEKKNAVDKRVENFYKNQRLNKAQVLSLLDGYIKEADKELEELKKSEPTKNQAALITWEENKTELQNFKDIFSRFTQNTVELNKAIPGILTQQVDLVSGYEERALDYFGKIEQVLDEHKAQNYYDIIENAQENTQEIHTYLTGRFSQYISQTIALIDNLMPQLIQQGTQLGANGYEIRDLTEQEKKEAADKKKAEAEARAAQKKQEPKGWWQTFTESIGSFFSSLWSSFTSLFSWGSKESPKPVVKEKVPIAKPAI